MTSLEPVVHLPAVMLFPVLVSVIGPPVIAIAVCGSFDVVMSMLHRKKNVKWNMEQERGKEKTYLELIKSPSKCPHEIWSDEHINIPVWHGAMMVGVRKVTLTPPRRLLLLINFIR